MVILIASFISVGDISAHDLSLKTQSLLICILLIVIEKNTLLLFYLFIVLTNYLVNTLNRPLDTRIKVVLYMIVTSLSKPVLLKLYTDQTPLMSVFAEKSEKHFMLF